MLDLTATLDPANGLAEALHVVPPDDLGLWTVAVDVGLGEHRRELHADGPTLDLVGACGWSRVDALVRGAGEAVERRALVSPECDPHRRAVPPDGEGRLLVATDAYGRADHALDAATVECLPAVELRADLTTVECQIPVCLVDDPVLGGERAWVDPGPTGAASGPSWAFAVERALLESVERDAAQAAWALRPAVQRIDTAEAADLAGPDGRGLLGALTALTAPTAATGLGASTARQLSAVTLMLPTTVRGASCAMTMIVDETDGRTMLASGAKAGWTALEAVLGSAREAVQVLALLGTIETTHAPWRDGEVVESDSARARWCLSPAAVAAAHDWLASTVPMSAHELLPAFAESQSGRSEPEDRLGSLVADLCDDGLRPIVCDLTSRLPTNVRRLGWHAVHAVLLGAQPLRMDERPQWSWARLRLELLAERWGVEMPVLARTAPHPLV